MKHSRLLKFGVPLALLIGISLAVYNTRCSVDMIPIQLVYPAKEYPITTLTEISDGKINSTFKGFPYFVTEVTKHLASKMDQENLCLNNVKSKEQSLVQFMPFSINVITPLASLPQLKAQPYDVCRINSPWVDLVIERKPIPMVRGIFRYNERQLLADQAILAGAQDVPPGLAMPLHYKEFDRYADFEYSSTEISCQLSEKPVEERVPPDLLWLFRRTNQAPAGSFSGAAISSLAVAMEVSSKAYTKVVIKLIDRCFESEGEYIHYNNILDLNDPELFEEYKIKISIVSYPE